MADVRISTLVSSYMDDVFESRSLSPLPPPENIRSQGLGEIEVLLVSSRRTRRVIIPKGWQESKKPWRAAEKEAREEGGVAGKIRHHPIGYFEYWKRLADHYALVKVDVYPLKVERSLKSWPERRRRAVKWLSTADAALLVDEPRLISMLRDFSGRTIRLAKSKVRKTKVVEGRETPSTLLVTTHPA